MSLLALIPRAYPFFFLQHKVTKALLLLLSLLYLLLFLIDTGITTIKPSGILTPLRTHAFVQTRTMTNPKEEKKKKPSTIYLQK